MTGRGTANWFVALAVPAGDWFARVAPPPRGVRLFAPEDLHVTVCFLGPVSRERAEQAFELATLWPTGIVDATLGGVEPMGNPRRPSALAARVDRGAAVLAHAIDAVRAPMATCAGVAVDTRPPLPHATLARPVRDATAAERAAAVEWARGLDLGAPAVQLSRLVLYTWADDRRSRLFREHASYPLAPLPAEGEPR